MIRTKQSAWPVPGPERAAYILDAALTLATSGGLRAVTPSEVARHAGLARPTIATYYPGGTAALRAAVMSAAVAREVLPVVAEGLIGGCPVARGAGGELRAACKQWIIEHLN